MDIAPSHDRAARLHGRRDVRLGPIAPPVPGPGQVIVRVTAVGLCGSDLHWYDEGSIGDTRLTRPLVLGHEFAGVVEGGERDGERVAVDPAEPCEACELCRAGRGRLCPDVRFFGLDPFDGALRTRVAATARRCAPIPGTIPDHEAVLLEVLGIALHAVDLARVRPGMSAGVYGAGPIGQLVIRVLRHRGLEVVATDRLAHRVAAAGASGAGTALMVGDEDPAASMPVDVAFECSGEDDGLDTAVRAVRPAGRVLMVGIPSGERAAFPASPVRRKELVLQAVRRMEAPDLPRAIALVASGEVSLAGLVTDRYPMDDVAAAFAHAAARAGLKTVVEPGR
ncbi:MAG TPA: alcohol dehydrogenase catalytic domain-containing protein [Candidatus Limnocylindrales bacterium]|nr:alcohol dehydrogenase catalytic domain-containing protein [Candidatus Limnocylindrales bacterium]